jgi:error-prone DNA polymerase
LAAHAERHLKPAEEMARLFRHYPDAVARTIAIAERCRFSLGELRYEYPDEATADGRTPQQELALRTWEGAARRYPQGIPDKVRNALVHELALIDELNYAPYFLTVWDIVCFACERGILCQGRGSAANSAVCFCLGVTAIDPAKFDLLFERFVSAARNEPPDIDVDFEHERREEVIQYIYEKYGRERAGLTAVVISYRGRSAVRDVGKAMGLSEDMVTALTRDYRQWGHSDVTREHFRDIGIDPDAPGVAQTMKFASDIQGFPRHLSQHVGGFVMTRGPLCDVVPIENAAMADRTVIEWDKDDLDALRILKVDVLALGMLTCIRKAFDLIALHYGRRFEIATVPSEDPTVYEMLQKADALGVFQVESRAQLSMLPRLKPKTFYDLVIEVAIVRPGPIQGGMVHPYLRRREGKDPITYPSPALEGVLRKTLGVPLFQEQAMNIAIVGAGFTPEEADRLRRSMASFKRNGDIAKFREKFVTGMTANGYARDFAERCFSQIEGFSTYGFPESHAASFAVLVYVSAWLKCHYPAVFAAALLNSQPMGFYAPAQLVRDARDHKVDVRDADVNKSDWDCTLEKKPDGTMALRLGLRQIVGFSADSGQKLMGNRGAGYSDPHAVWRHAGLPPAALEVLARADAWRSMGLGRREALWAIRALGATPLPLFAALDSEAVPEATEPAVALPPMTPGEAVVDDYRSLHLTLREHPLTFLRDGLMRSGVVPARHLADIPAGGYVTVAGLVLVRQRPGSAKGIVFVTLEDETGIANLIVYPDIFERDRRALLGARLMGATGRIERQGAVIHILVRRIHDWTARLHALIALPDNAGLARADEVKRPGFDRRGLPVASRDFH